MKKLSVMLVVAALLAGVALGTMAAPSFAQQIIEKRTYVYPPPPPNPAAAPWVGPGTPWVYYNGDWFYNGTLYYDFGPRYGWAPYFAYDPTYIVRPGDWYDPKWSVWYKEHPENVEVFVRTYPYWEKHAIGQVYDQDFYILHEGKKENRWRKAWRELREDKD